jgi:hypothetical protein
MTRLYRVQLAQTVCEKASIVVEAESEEEAMEKACPLALEDGVHWHFDDTYGDIEAISAREWVGPVW